MLKIDRSFRPDRHTIPQEGTVEVAQIVYRDGLRGDISPASSPGVATVSARMREGGIVYRIDVDGGCESFERKPCPLPLTLGQLIHFIDSSGNGVALWSHLQRAGQRPVNMPRFHVTSAHYPMLSDYFAARGEAWMKWRLGTRRRVSAQRLATIRKGLLWRLDTSDRQRGITRTEAERQAEVDRCLALRF